MNTETIRQTQGGRAPRRKKRIWLWIVLVFCLGCVGEYVFLRIRATERQQQLDEFMVLDARHECCEYQGTSSRTLCRKALENLIELSQAGEFAADAPHWIPTPIRDPIDQLRHADEVSHTASLLYWQCPAAHEIAETSSRSPAERMCGLVATRDQRDDLAREAAKRGTLIPGLTSLHCSSAGYEAGLRRIQIDFDKLCQKDACLSVLLEAPSTSRTRVREIVSAHPDAVLTSLVPHLGPEGDPRVVDILSDVFGRDARTIAALSLDDLSGLELSSALDLLELPLNPRKIFLLRQIRNRGHGRSAAVAAVFLDAAEAILATEPELREGLLALGEYQCQLVEKAFQRLDLGLPERADASLPALIRCPQAAQLALADADRLALTDAVLEAALDGRFLNVDALIIDRLDKTDVATLERFVALSARPELERSARRVADSLRKGAAARYEILENAFGSPRWASPSPAPNVTPYPGRQETPRLGAPVDQAVQAPDASAPAGERNQPAQDSIEPHEGEAGEPGANQDEPRPF